jgi:hypothetical protein
MSKVKTQYSVGIEGGAARALVEVMAYVNQDRRVGKVKSSGRGPSVIHFLRKVYGAATLLSPAIHPDFSLDFDGCLGSSKHYLADEYNRLAGCPLGQVLELFRDHLGIDDIKAIVHRLDVLRKKDTRFFFVSCPLHDLFKYSLVDWEKGVTASPDSTDRNAYPLLDKYTFLVDQLLVQTLQERKREGLKISPELVFGIFGMGRCLVRVGALYLPSSSVQQASAFLISPNKNQSSYLVLPDFLGKQDHFDHYKWLDDHWATTSLLRFKLGSRYPKTFAWLQTEFKVMSLEAFAPFQLAMGTYASNTSNLERVDSISRLFSRL